LRNVGFTQGKTDAGSKRHQRLELLSCTLFNGAHYDDLSEARKLRVHAILNDPAEWEALPTALRQKLGLFRKKAQAA
jgi:hypothetical protein